ncbi:MAG: hypothetical protein JWO88_2282 [Frankiales bacterium]|nr:hypothetical protein [Frankiales bacterium]
MLLALVGVAAASVWGLTASGAFQPAKPKPTVTTHVVFTAVSKAALPGPPPCYPRPGLNVATGAADPGASFGWEMLGSATPAEVAAQRACLGHVAGLADLSERVVTGPPGGRM